MEGLESALLDFMQEQSGLIVIAGLREGIIKASLAYGGKKD